MVPTTFLECRYDPEIVEVDSALPWAAAKGRWRMPTSKHVTRENTTAFILLPMIRIVLLLRFERQTRLMGNHNAPADLIAKLRCSIMKSVPTTFYLLHRCCLYRSILQDLETWQELHPNLQPW